jgi:hypothetical protein
MADYQVKRGDTQPPLKATLTQRDITSDDPQARVPINLSSATAVAFRAKNRKETKSFGGACTVTDATNGKVQWPIDTAFTANVDSFLAEFEITWTGGAKQTVPNDGYFEVEVVKDLG